MAAHQTSDTLSRREPVLPCNSTTTSITTSNNIIVGQPYYLKPNIHILKHKINRIYGNRHVNA